MEGHAVLIVAATPAEVAPLVAQLGPAEPAGARTSRYRFRNHIVDVLTAGVGMVPTAAWCSRLLVQTQYDCAFNFGLCGSFTPAIPPGRVVHVIEDRLSELGAENGDRFIPVEQLGLAAEDVIVNNVQPTNAALAALPTVTGITVSTVHGAESTIAAVVSRCRPDVESMEGAAFMYSCAMAAVPYAQVRAVSNVVERRNRESWKVREAVESLTRAAISILAAL